MSITRTSFTYCASNTTHTADYPATAASGDVVFVVIRGSSFSDAPLASTFSAAFVNLFTTNTTQSQSAGYYRILDGTEGASFTFSGPATNRYQVSVYHVTNFAGSASNIVGSSATGLNPPSVSAPVGATAMSWIAGLTWQYNEGSVTAYPTGYTGTEHLTCTGTTILSRPNTAFGLKDSDGTAEDPSAFTLSVGNDPAAFTVGFATVDPTNWGVRISGIKEPNAADQLVTGVSNARVRVWSDGDDTTATSFTPSTGQSITSGVLETSLEGAEATTGAVVSVDWDAGGGEIKFFRTITNIVDLDDVSSGP